MINEIWKTAWKWSLALVVVMLFSTSLPLVTLFLLRGVIDSVVAASHDAAAAQATWPHVRFLLFAWAALGLLSALSSAVQAWLSERQSIAVSFQVQEIVEVRSMRMDLSYYDNAEVHDSLFRAQQQAGWHATQTVQALATLLQGTLLSLGLLGMLVAVAPKLVLILLVFWVPGVLMRWTMARRSHARNVQRTPLERRVWMLHFLMVSVEAAQEIRLFGQGKALLGYAQRIREKLCTMRMQNAAEAAVGDLTVIALGTIGAVCASGWLAWESMSGAMTAGSMVMLLGVLQRGQEALKLTQSGVGALTENLLFLRAMRTFLSLPPRAHLPATPVEVPESAPVIRFERVSFRYPGSEHLALNGVDIDFPAGGRIALVGENGGGKSTLVKLLCRLYDPQGGRITWNGVDVLDYRDEDLQAVTTAVFQDPMRYPMTMLENIWLGNVALEPTDERIALAAKAAGLDAVMRRLPKGLDTILGRDIFEGDELSAGQWQRLSLARAYMRDAALIVLDEPTSSLDPDAEAEIFTRFLDLARGRTTVFVTHRLSSTLR